MRAGARPRLRWLLAPLWAALAFALSPRAAAAEEDPVAKAMAGIRADIQAHRWPAARQRLRAFAQSFADPDEATKKAIEALRSEYATHRAGAFAETAKHRWPKIVRARIETWIEREKPGLEQATTWVLSVLAGEADAALLKELHDADPKATIEEAQRAWRERPKTDADWAPLLESLIVVAPDPKPPMPLPAEERSRAWRRASAAERVEECFRCFVKSSGRFEIEDRAPPGEPMRREVCPRCNGAGALEFQLSTGASVTVLCPRCGGKRSRGAGPFYR